MTAITDMQYKLQNEADVEEEMCKQQENTKDHFLSQEISRHGVKSMSIKSWLKRNSKEKYKVGYSYNLCNKRLYSDFSFTNVTEINILNQTELVEG